MLGFLIRISIFLWVLQKQHLGVIFLNELMEVFGRWRKALRGEDEMNMGMENC